jgi:hypothetical protein
MVGAWDQNMWDDITFGNLATAAPSILTAWDQNFWDDITFGNLATAAADILSAWDQDSSDDVTLSMVGAWDQNMWDDLTFSNYATVAANYWQQSNGVLSPYSSTLDLMVGGTATGSANFHVLGIEDTGSTMLTLASDTITTGKVASIISTALNGGDLLYLANNTNNAGNILHIQAGVSLTDRLTFDSSGLLKIFNNDGTEYISLQHDGTDAIISASTGNVVLGSGAGDIVIGEEGTAVNILFAETAAIKAASGKTIALENISSLTPDSTITSGTFGWFQRNTGAISPYNITDDLLLGAISTGSATIALNATTGNIFVSGGLSTYDTTVTDGYVEASGLCLGNGTNCITSWSDGSVGTNYWSKIAGVLSPALAEPLAATSGATTVATFTSTGTNASLTSRWYYRLPYS